MGQTEAGGRQVELIQVRFLAGDGRIAGLGGAGHWGAPSRPRLLLRAARARVDTQIFATT